MKLHGYFRSSAAWRVRIALALKGLDYDQVFVHLRHGDQRAPAYLKVNPQGLVPALEVEDGAVLTQSLAICEYLDEVYPQSPVLPGTALARHLAPLSDAWEPPGCFGTREKPRPSGLIGQGGASS